VRHRLARFAAEGLAVITPAAAMAGVLVRRRNPLGYLLAAPLLVTIVLLLPTIALSTALQAAAGISFTVPQIVGPIAGFAALGGVGTYLACPPAARRPHLGFPDRIIRRSRCPCARLI
jgi:hypothetical protein